MKVPVSVVVLACNEAANIGDCLASVAEWADEVWVVDSGSTDETLAIARRYTDKIAEHPFENYSLQRNWAQDTLALRNEWVLHLDADERVTPELAREIAAVLAQPRAGVNGYFAARRTMFMGRWIRHGGHYPVYHLRLFRRSAGRCEPRKYHQHYLVQGATAVLKGDLIDVFSSDVTTMVERHNRWATAEAAAIMEGERKDQVQGKPFGTPVERRRWLRTRVYGRMPLLVRPLLLFVYRYVLRLGFLDGTEGLIFHFLQGCWAQFMVDAKVIEMRRSAGRTA